MLKNKDFKIFIMDKTNPSYKIHEQYRELHRKCSGRITRPKETFDLQYKMLEEGAMVLIGLKYKNKTIALSYFEAANGRAVYSSSADDPEYSELPLYHVILYAAMEYFKKNGVRYISASQPSSPSRQFDYYPDEKQLNIALFKRGFPGDYKPNFRGIKYFSEELFEKDLMKFKKLLTNQLTLVNQNAEKK